MNGLITVHEITVVGGLAFIFIFLALWISQTGIRRDDISPFKQAGLALQLSGSAAVVKKAVDDENSANRALLRTSVKRDFVFIFGYATFFVALGLLLSQVRTSGAMWLGLTSAVVMLLAAGFDFVENYRAWQVLSLSSDSITDPLCGAVRQVSLFKWFFFFLTIGLQSVILLKLKSWYWLIGVGMMLSALAGVVGLRFHGLIPLANGILGLSVLVIAGVLVAIPQKLTRLFP